MIRPPILADAIGRESLRLNVAVGVEFLLVLTAIGHIWLLTLSATLLSLDRMATLSGTPLVRA